MRRERALKVVLVLVGLLFSACFYPLMVFVRQEPALAMMLSLYVTLGIFFRMPCTTLWRISPTTWLTSSSGRHRCIRTKKTPSRFLLED